MCFSILLKRKMELIFVISCKLVFHKNMEDLINLVALNTNKIQIKQQILLKLYYWNEFTLF